ncbi:MAG: hypothetical protein ACREPB_05990 [Arenimonas sp.]
MKIPLTLVLLTMSNAVSADVSLFYPQHAECKSTVAAMQISGSRMRFDSVMDSKKYSTVFDGMEDMITMLDHAEHRYHQTELDEDALDYNKDVMSSTGTFMDNQMKTVQAQMKQQCAQMEKQGMRCPDMDLSSMMQSAQAMMGQGTPKMEIRQSDKNQTTAGMACKTFERYENGIKVTEECYIAPKDFSMSDKDKKYLLRNMKVMLRYSDTFAGLTKKFSLPEPDQTSQPDPTNSDILLLQICLSPDGSEAGRIEVQISNALIDEASFEIPPGYQVMNMTQ